MNTDNNLSSLSPSPFCFPGVSEQPQMSCHANELFLKVSANVLLCSLHVGLSITAIPQLKDFITCAKNNKKYVMEN